MSFFANQTDHTNQRSFQVFGYNYDKISKFELEILTDVSDMFGGKDAPIKKGQEVGKIFVEIPGTEQKTIDFCEITFASNCQYY